MSDWRALLGAVACSGLVACTSAPPAKSPTSLMADLPATPSPAASPHAGFERKQRERALSLTRQGHLGEAALAWEILVVLRPDVDEYRDRLAQAQHRGELAAADHAKLAAQASSRGEIDKAAQHHLAVLALLPDDAAAADALRDIERVRNKRNFLGKFSRITLTRRAVIEAEMATTRAARAPRLDRTELEHAALLAGEGEFGDAVALLERRLAADRRDVAARHLLADVYYRQAEALLPRDKAAAILALAKSLRLNPKDERALARMKQLQGGKAADAAPAASPSRPAAKRRPN